MDLDQLRTFDRIARDLSFTKAAARLNVTQATVSMRMRALEDLLGVSLFHRGRTVSLTDQGMTFLPYARRMLLSAQEAREALRRSERGSVGIASLRTMIAPVITEALLRFQAVYPGLDVVVTEGHHAHLTAMLHDRSVDLGLIAWPNLDPLVQDAVPLLVMRETVPLVMSPGLAARLGPRPGVAEILAVQPRVLSQRWWQADPDPVRSLARRAGIHVEVPTDPARMLALRGEGVGYFVRNAVADDLAAGRLVEITPADLDPVHRDVALVAVSEDVLARPPVRVFAEEIAARCATLGAILENRLASPALAAE